MRWLLLALLLIACSDSDSGPAQREPETADDAGADTPEVKQDAPTPALIAAVRQHDPAVLDSLKAASRACRILGQRGVGRDALVATVATDLPDLDPGHAVRAACARALGDIGGPEATETLLAVLHDRDEARPVQSAAIAALGALGEDRAAAPIVALMVRHPQLGDAARLALTALGPPAVEPLLAALEGAPPDGVQEGTAAFVAARALGDLRAPDAVPALLESLAAPPQPAMVNRSGEAGPSHHVGVIEGLRKIGGPRVGPALRAYARERDEPSLRTLALDAYGLVDADPDVPAALLELFDDDDADGRLRVAAGLAYARHATADRHVAALAGRAEGFAAGTGDRARSLFLITAGLIARAHVGASCADDRACFEQVLSADAPGLVETILGRIPHGETLSPAERGELAPAARERALIGLRRMGATARPARDAILQAVASDHRLVHQAALDALVAVAERPCPACAEQLAALVEEPATDDPVARQMHRDTVAVKHYFAAATAARATDGE